MIEEKVVFESPGKNPLGHPYLTVKQVGHYMYSERAGVDSVAFILYDKSINKFCAINERKPPLDARFDKEVFLTTAFGGSLDSETADETDIVVAECREEAGYRVTREDVISLGQVMVSTQSNQMAHLFVVLVDKEDVGDTDPENEMEAQATTVWFEEIESINFQDWKIATIIQRGKLSYKI